MKNIRIKATVNYENRITINKIYKAERENNDSYVYFKDNNNYNTTISYKACKDGSWFKIMPNELNKNIKVL